MNLDTATIVTAIVPTVFILGVGWLLKRVVRANQADASDATRRAVNESETRIKAHVDRRVDDLAREVRRLDAGLDGTVKDVTWLYGHLGQTPPSGGGGL